MIEVNHLTKRYGNHIAVNDLSFKIEKGVIYGFLGPNGAGKSTTMNIITGCLGATEGEVSIGGHNIMDEPVEAKKLIGYLPELPPVYGDMTAKEYLRFVAEAKGIAVKRREAQVQSVMRRARIEEVQNRLIRNLSKGYRQRVGIAQALLGDPEVIILDEPTVGLDPKQIIEIRDLIRSLGEKHTVVLSSHILSEVQAVCDHIMIISNGKLVASDTAENLTKLFSGKKTICVESRADKEKVAAILNSVDGIESVEITESDGMTAAAITPAEGADLREEIFKAFAQSSAALTELHQNEVSLEKVFLELTQSDEQSGEAQEEVAEA